MPTLNWLSAAAGAVVTALVAFGLHSVDVHFIEKSWQKKLDDQHTADVAACDKDKAITKGTNDALQKDRDAIARKLADFKRMQPSHCVPVAALKTEPATGGDGHAGQNGIGLESDWLREYAAECENYRRQRITLESFIDGTWAAHGQ